MILLPKDRLKMARKRAGYPTPSKAARALSILNVNTLTSHENGNRDISRKMAKRYGEVFNVDPGWILYGESSQDNPSLNESIPLISWVSAGELSEQEGITNFLDCSMIEAVNLPAGEWIALRVDGSSMNKISPPDSIIFVNMRDKKLVPNACYVIADETGRATYKRYRPNDNPPFQPASYDRTIKAPKLEGAISIIGRVRRTILEM
ncbi:LexA family transcriptional regulator [Bartonella bovis]|uniref:Phage repressor protein n=2 Tax=Bartonella bovis TaxID=155194 RepID=N6VJB9_9HYPH|nr:XRE family transcriptional regulator [Bartonella bovis]ENN91112.1 phage repressor protein [Bartonella bovis 91-4]ENN93817.1 phage repressor protein [Bartonella bovis m02]